MAINILFILFMSVEAKQVFLGIWRMVSWDCMSLRSTNIERTEYLKSWLLSNIMARGGLMAISVIEEAFDVLAN